MILTKVQGNPHDNLHLGLINMNFTLRAAIALILTAHGLVHPILAIVPDNEKENAQVGSFWNTSWMLGQSPFVKQAMELFDADVTRVMDAQRKATQTETDDV